jgi:NADH-quinone oxidoreductase subunit M
LVLSRVLWFQHARTATVADYGTWLVEVQWPWIPQLGISFHLAMDGLSLVLVMLTIFLGLMAVVASWPEIQERVGLFYFNVLWVLAGVVGVFLAMDLFLFYVFWEIMLVPIYFLIGIWGHENRVYAAIKFFIFTQASSLCMLLAIVTLFFLHQQHTGTSTFDYAQLLGTPMGATTATWLMVGFVIAFAVKLPAFPLHTWLPDAHTEAPTAGSVILASLLLKTGAYGLMRFVMPHPITSLLILDRYGLLYLALLLLLATLGAMVLVASQHFAALFLGLEILSVALYALLAYLRTDMRLLEAGLKYLILTRHSHRGTLCLLPGLHPRALGAGRCPCCADSLARVARCLSGSAAVDDPDNGRESPLMHGLAALMASVARETSCLF